jgi:Spy/CpxP family protein refolding chaperone
MAIAELDQARHTAEAPVRQADAQVLLALAHQVEQASIDPSALAQTLSARAIAAAAARAADLVTTQKLHDLLTPAQRNQLVDNVGAQLRSHIDSRKGDWDAGHRSHGNLGKIAEKLGLTDQQKAQILANLRAEHRASGDARAHDAAFHGAGKAWLDSFRDETYNAAGAAPSVHQRAWHRGDRGEHLIAAVVPVLSSVQRAQLANDLRARAAHESQL